MIYPDCQGLRAYIFKSLMNSFLSLIIHVGNSEASLEIQITHKNITGKER